MRTGVTVGVACALAVWGAACAMPPTGVQRAQQTAQDFNLDSRFGRNELALARVDSKVRDDYAEHHKAWGASVRIADVEMAGFKPHGDADVDVFVRVAWYRMDQQELRTTLLKQAWHSKSDDWLLVSEQRMEGDPGLLGEPVVVQVPSEPRPTPQFPTVRLNGSVPESQQ
jgi:hypothetical protein